MLKILIILLVVFVTAVIQVLADRALGIDFSSISTPKRIFHDVLSKLIGGAIAATIWFI